VLSTAVELMYHSMASTSQSGAAFLISSMKQRHAEAQQRRSLHTESRAQNLFKTGPAPSTLRLGSPKPSGVSPRLSGSDFLGKSKPSPRPTSPKLGKGLFSATQHARVATVAAEERPLAVATAPASTRPAEKNCSEVHPESHRVTRSRGAARSPEPLTGPDRFPPFTTKLNGHQQKQSLQPLCTSPDVSVSKNIDASTSTLHWQTRSEAHRQQQQPRQALLRQQLLGQQRRSLQAGDQETKCREHPMMIGGKDHTANANFSPLGSSDKSRRLPAPARSESQRPQNPVLLGHPLSHAETNCSIFNAKPKAASESCSENIFVAMERLGKAARNRGQHVLVKDAVGRKRLARWDCIA